MCMHSDCLGLIFRDESVLAKFSHINFLLTTAAIRSVLLCEQGHNRKAEKEGGKKRKIENGDKQGLPCLLLLLLLRRISAFLPRACRCIQLPPLTLPD